MNKSEVAVLILYGLDFKANNITRHQERYFIMIKGNPSERNKFIWKK